MDKENKSKSSNKSRDNMTNSKKYEFYINNPLMNLQFNHKSNTINQSKYNIITFLPKALLIQFMRLANVYFLIIAIVQLIPIISPLTPLTAIVPITFVLTVSLIREGIEDYNRHVYDDQLNNEPVTVFRDQSWIQDRSGDLLIGEIVYVKQNDPFPSDLILLDSNLTDGLCFIETATLDGEKTLKNKIANKATAGCFNNGGNKIESFNLNGYCVCEGPNSELYRFDGNLDLNFSDKNQSKETKISVPIEAKQILLKGI